MTRCTSRLLIFMTFAPHFIPFRCNSFGASSHVLKTEQPVNDVGVVRTSEGAAEQDPMSAESQDQDNRQAYFKPFWMHESY
jgi:hypothetical protein